MKSRVLPFDTIEFCFPSAMKTIRFYDSLSCGSLIISIDVYVGFIFLFIYFALCTLELLSIIANSLLLYK